MSWQDDRLSSRTVQMVGYKEALASMDSEKVRNAARNALKRVAASARSAFSEQIRSVYNVKRGDLDKRIATTSWADGMTASVRVNGYSMSLSYFGAKQFAGGTVTSRSKNGLQTKQVKKSLVGPRASGVQVKVIKGRTALLQRAFLATMKSGHIGVFRRLGKKRLPIDEKNVISFASMAKNVKVEPVVLARIRERWDVEFPRQLDYYKLRGK